MRLSNKTPYELLAKQFANETSPAEEAEIVAWLNADDTHRLVYAEVKEQWCAARFEPQLSIIPRKKATWGRILHRIENRRPMYPRAVLIRVASLAAAVALLVGYSISTFTSPSTSGSEPQQFVVATQSGQKSQLYLPDGTQVWLNAGAKLSYPSNFNSENRNVSLEGEAYFSVEKSTDYPFIVSIGEVSVKVHGTEFNVKAPIGGSSVAVALVEGSVSLLSTHTMEELTRLSPNQLAKVDRKQLTTDVVACNAVNESLWHRNKLFFDHISQEEMWEKLEGWYGVRFAIKNAKPETTYRFSLKTESLNELLTLINRLTPIEYTLNGEEVNIRYK